MRRAFLTSLLAVLAVVGPALADPPEAGVIKDRTGYFPVRKYAPVPGKAIGILFGEAREVVALDGRSGPADALVLSVGGNSCRWVYVPTTENPQITNLQVPVGDKGEKQIFPALSMASPRSVIPWGVTALYSLVEVTVNSGLGSPADEGFVATNIKVLDGSKEFPLNVAEVVASLKKQYAEHLKAKQHDIEKAMSAAAAKALKDRKPTGPREKSELMYLTWLPQSETMQVRFRTRLTDGAYTISDPLKPQPALPPLPKKQAQDDIPKLDLRYRIAPRKEVRTKSGTSFTIEFGRSFEVNRKGEVVRIDDLPIEASVQEVQGIFDGPAGPPPLPKGKVQIEAAVEVVPLAAAAVQRLDGAKEPQVLARGYWPHGKANPDAAKKGETVAIRSAAELVKRSPWSELDAPQQVVEKSAAAAVAKLLKVDDIDWTRQMLIVVTAGPRPTGGWKVSVDSLKVEGKKLTVGWSVTPPKGFATQAFTHPGEVVLVERFDGEVVFAAKASKDRD